MEHALKTKNNREVASASGRRLGFLQDLTGGLTAAAVVLPKAMAYASVAGLPVAVGLYTAFTPMAIYALLGSSRVLSVSSTTTLAILTGAELEGLAIDGGSASRAVATLVALVGIVLVLARVLKLGFVANFISIPVLTGFKAGIGLVIVLDQAPKLLGLHVPKQSFFTDALSVVRSLPETSVYTASVAAVSLCALVALKQLKPGAPAPLLSVAAAILASWALGLSASGVGTVGFIPKGLPSLTPPDLTLVRDLLPGAFGIALMSFTETIAAGRAFADQDDPPINANRELIATGAANLGGALLGAMPAGGGASQTGVARAAGANSQRASLVTSAAALATMLVLAPLLGFLPQATLASIVILYSVVLIQPAEFLSIYRVRRMEFHWSVVAAVGVLVFGTLQGIVVAIILSVVGLARQTAQPRVSVIGRKHGADVLRPVSPEHPDDETFEGLLILRPEGRLYFGNAQVVADRIATFVADRRPRVLVLDLSRVPDLEYTALEMLRDGLRRAEKAGVEFWLVGLNPEVLAVVRNAQLDKELGPGRLLFNARAAIELYNRVTGQMNRP